MISLTYLRVACPHSLENQRMHSVDVVAVHVVHSRQMEQPHGEIIARWDSSAVPDFRRSFEYLTYKAPSELSLRRRERDVRWAEGGAMDVTPFPSRAAARPALAVVVQGLARMYRPDLRPRDLSLD